MSIRSQSDRDRANPPLVGGLDLDRKWIITGNEVITWQAHSLIEVRVCRRRRAVLGLYRKRMRCCMYGEQTVSKASWIGYPETRLCNSEWQVCYHVTIIGPCAQCVRILTQWRI